MDTNAKRIVIEEGINLVVVRDALGIKPGEHISNVTKRNISEDGYDVNPYGRYYELNECECSCEVRIVLQFCDDYQKRTSPAVNPCFIDLPQETSIRRMLEGLNYNMKSDTFLIEGEKRHLTRAYVLRKTQRVGGNFNDQFLKVRVFVFPRKAWSKEQADIYALLQIADVARLDSSLPEQPIATCCCPNEDTDYARAYIRDMSI